MDRNSKITGHNQRNAELVRVFSSKQVDLHQARSVELHFWAWGQPNSVRLAHELYQQGFIVLVLKPAFIEDGKDRCNRRDARVELHGHDAAGANALGN